jgi:hypothetical protein
VLIVVLLNHVYVTHRLFHGLVVGKCINKYVIFSIIILIFSFSAAALKEREKRVYAQKSRRYLLKAKRNYSVFNVEEEFQRSSSSGDVNDSEFKTDEAFAGEINDASVGTGE